MKFTPKGEVIALKITDASIVVATKPNELHIVTLYYTIRRANELAGMVGNFSIPISDIWLARELFDRYRK